MLFIGAPAERGDSGDAGIRAGEFKDQDFSIHGVTLGGIRARKSMREALWYCTGEAPADFALGKQPSLLIQVGTKTENEASGGNRSGAVVNHQFLDAHAESWMKNSHENHGKKGQSADHFELVDVTFMLNHANHEIEKLPGKGKPE